MSLMRALSRVRRLRLNYYYSRHIWISQRRPLHYQFLGLVRAEANLSSLHTDSHRGVPTTLNDVTARQKNSRSRYGNGGNETFLEITRYNIAVVDNTEPVVRINIDVVANSANRSIAKRHAP